VNARPDPKRHRTLVALGIMLLAVAGTLILILLIDAGAHH
jgi:hypothetical protein